MIRKLLLLVYSSFFNSFSEKVFSPSIKLLFLTMFLVVNLSHGQTRTWNGSSSNNWSTGANWSGNTAPTTANDVIIPSGTPNNPVITSNAITVKSLNISGILTIGNNGTPRTLTVSAGVTINPGGQLVTAGSGDHTLNITGNLVNDGIFNMNSGTGDSTTIFNGTGTISGNGTTTDFFDLTLANGGSLVLNKEIRIADDWTNNGKTVSGSGRVTFIGTGSSIGGGTITSFPNLTITNNGTTTLAKAAIVTGNFNIDGGATFSTTNNNNYALTLGGDFTNNGDFNAFGSAITINGGSNQNIAGFDTTGIVTMSKTGGTAIFTGGVTSTKTLTINGAGGTLNLGTRLTHSFLSVTLTNGILNGGSSTINLSANSPTNPFIGNGTFFIPATGTVNLNGGAQNTVLSNFYNLTLSGNGSKTFSAATTKIANILSITSTSSKGILVNSGAHTAAALTIEGSTRTAGVYGGGTNPSIIRLTNYFTNTSGIVTITADPCMSFTGVAPITRVTLNSLDSPTSESSIATYENITTKTTTLNKGDSYSLVVKGNTSGDVNTYYTAFFDWNGNGSFDTAETPIEIGTIKNSSGIDEKATSIYFQVPPGATGTTIKMRIIGSLIDYNETPCTVNTNTGQVEDYTITLQSGCTGTMPSTVSTTSTVSTVCPNIPLTLSLGNTFGDGATYSWESAPSLTGPWTSAATPSLPFFTSTFSANQTHNTTVGDIALGGDTDTEIIGGVLVLTDTALNGHNGGFLIDKANTPNINPFTATFKYRIQDGTPIGADGMSLSYGEGFTATGGGGESGEGSGLIIQFDTYDNEAVLEGSRVRILYNNTSIFNAAINVPFNLRTADYKNVNLNVDTNGYLTLSIESSTPGVMTTVVSKLLLPGYEGADKSTWKFKFSARTGGSKDKHSIDDLTITFLDSANSKSKFTTSQTTKTYYRAKITCGGNVTSDPVLVDMTSAVITTQPTAPAAICSGAGVRTITVAATGGLTYTWRLGTTPIVNGGVFSGQGTNTLTLTNPLAANAGNYDVVITGACPSTVTSDPVTVIVNPLPIPAFAPLAVTSTCVGSTVTYTTASGMSNYIWQFPGVPGTNYTIAAGGTSADNSVSIIYKTIGSKTVTVNYTNGNGCTATAATSSPAVTVNDLPIILTQPQALILCEGQNGAFTISTSATSPTYQWQYSTSTSGPWTATNTAPITGISGHNTATLSIANVATIYSGNFVRCIVTSGTCSTISNPVSLTVNPAPTAPTVGTPTNLTCTNQGSVILTNLPAGNWTLNQTGSISRTINNSGNTYPVTGLAAGTYRFTVSNGTCTSAVSTDAIIIDQSSTTWDGSGWSNGLPNAAKSVIITGAFNVTADLNACSLTISSGVSITVPSSRTLNIENGVTVAPTASLIFENNSSLVQKNDSGINSGSITYKRIAPQIRLSDFVYWSTPVSPQQLLKVSPLTSGDKFFGYNGTAWVITNPNNNMTVGKGYIIRAPSNFSTTAKADYPVSFIGAPNNGIITGETVTAGNFYLIGNPYPSGLSADKFLANNLFLDGTLYFWTHNTPVVLVGAYRYSSTDYASYNLTGGVATKLAALSGSIPGNNNDRPTGFVGAGQSFFINASTNGTVAFNNDMRLGADKNSQFFKNAGAIQKSRVWLNMTNAEGAFKQTLVGYVEGATNEYENRYDGVTFDANPYLDFYSVANGNNYVIQARAFPFTDTDQVPLGYRTTIAGDFTISIDNIDGDLTNKNIYLEDKKTSTINDLRAGNYTFTTTVGTFADRFVLRYASKTLGTGDFENVENGLLVSVKDKTIKVTSSIENIKEVTIFDVSGKLLYNKKKVGSTELQIQNLPSANQVLLVKVTLDNNFTATKKIIFN